MDFNFSVEQTLQGVSQKVLPNGAHICLLKSDKVSFIGGQVTQVIDRMGTASSHAQGLGTVITTHAKLVQAQGNQHLYMIVRQN